MDRNKGVRSWRWIYGNIARDEIRILLQIFFKQSGV